MENTGKQLHEYKKPPIIEVVCGVQFGEIKLLQSVHYGEFWQRIKADYPKTEDMPPLREVFELKETPAPGVQLEAFEMPPLRRIFFVDPTENYLLQMQPTRFLANWRKRSKTDEYPRFSKAYARFISGWNEFTGFVKNLSGTSPVVNQFELTYINHMFEKDIPYPLGMNHYLSFISLNIERIEAFLPLPKSFQSRLQFTLPNSSGALHITASHGRRNIDGEKVMVLDLTARGPAKNGIIGMDEWFNLAHEWIVRGFTDISSTAAHKEWERTV
jgi:uncharacterized protein (TIGR04255 family)